MSLPASLTLYGTATAPAAGTAIVSIPNVAAGIYTLTAWALLSGTLGAPELDNLRIQAPTPDGSGGQQNGPRLLLVPTANIWAPPLVIARFVVGANGAVSINAVGNATAASVYRALLNLDPLVN
jgi:hypothetical protein